VKTLGAVLFSNRAAAHLGMDNDAGAKHKLMYEFLFVLNTLRGPRRDTFSHTFSFVLLIVLVRSCVSLLPTPPFETIVALILLLPTVPNAEEGDFNKKSKKLNVRQRKNL
jgi:hypothetical protein